MEYLLKVRGRALIADSATVAVSSGSDEQTLQSDSVFPISFGAVAWDYCGGHVLLLWRCGVACSCVFDPRVCPTWQCGV